MNLTVTLGLMALGAVAAVGCGWMGARPKNYLKPRLIPWQMLMLVCGIFVLAMAIHLLNLFGMTTGGAGGR
jgi:hypothetical protein